MSDIAFESPEQFKAYQLMQAEHPGAVEHLVNQLGEYQAQVQVLEAELSKRKGVRYPDFTPDDQCAQVWTFWKDDFGPRRYQWITRNRCSLVDGEYWRVDDQSAPNQEQA